ncbi:signal peptidase II [Parendozoicomonas haliclonae]|uniref:Lipoprotein signal peptidase n=1 Tax=Parendozoicomonas haliclonae TaxID=1960125 RepID=A0A1X7ASG8_9GAMM|nr:signal peptidase II [Parendozoicomonas haliclonae]SMA50367.1 Lipoprotein signal peptidase [Parendozoicomonas haliclonae]
MIRSPRLFSLSIFVSLLIFTLDQLTKFWFDANFSLYEQVPVIADFFSFTLAYNTGAAFSFLSSAGGWQRWFFIGIAVAVSVALVIWISRLEKDQKLQAAALTLILGGALGNLWDRAIFGHVIDFILVHYEQSWFFPAFNIADIGITMGAGLMILDMFINPESSSEK